MHKKVILALLVSLVVPTLLHAQDDPAEPKTNDTPQSNRFWQASLSGGHYMVALDRISAISRHKYVLDGAVIVDEVTVDALGQALARFYFISPITDAGGGTEIAAAASRAVDRGRELIDRAAGVAGTGIHNMVVKKFPETTHSRTIEFRVMSEQELSGLYSSVRTAWESGKGRKFTIK
jgi:hypothetical protein